MLSAASPILRSRPSWLKAAQRPLSSGVPTENSDKLAGEDEGRKRVPKPTPHAAATILQSACLRTTATPRPQPTLFHLAGLEAKPLWSAQNARASGGFDDGSAPPEDSTAATNENTPANLAFPWLSELGRPENIDAMTSEYEALVADGVPSDYSTKDSSREGGEHKMHKGDWSWHTYVSKGVAQSQFQERCPKTARLLKEVVGSDLMLGTPFSFAFFSTLHPESSIAPHAAPCNLRLRVHVPLLDASTDPLQCGLRVGNEVVPWTRDKGPVVFDDAYEHEVWNRTSVARTVLLFDVWHPGITLAERISIIEMFESMKR